LNANYEKRSNAQVYLAGMERLKASYRRLIRNAAQTIVNKETQAVKRAAKKYLTQRSINDFKKWFEEFYKTHGNYVEQNLGPVLRSYQELILEQAGSLIGEDISIEELENFFNEVVANRVYAYVKSSSGQLISIIEKMPPEQLIEAITVRMDEWFEKRAEKIARDEITRSANAVARETWKLQGSKKFVWVTRGKNCPFEKLLEGMNHFFEVARQCMPVMVG